MVTKKTFRLVCSFIGLIMLMGILTSSVDGGTKIAGTCIGFFIIIFGFVSTGKWGEYFRGENESFG